MKKSKSRAGSVNRVIAVAAPGGWEEMFRKNPEGPEIQAFLNAALREANARERRARQRKGRTAARDRGENTRAGSDAKGALPASKESAKDRTKVKNGTARAQGSSRAGPNRKDPLASKSVHIKKRRKRPN
jgi:hypothetical protein